MGKDPVDTTLPPLTKISMEVASMQASNFGWQFGVFQGRSGVQQSQGKKIAEAGVAAVNEPAAGFGFIAKVEVFSFGIGG